MFVDCQHGVIVFPADKQSYNLNELLHCEPYDKRGHEMSYEWTDSKGVVVSNTSETTLTEKGSFNWTCTITDERNGSVCSASLNGSKIIVFVYLFVCWFVFLSVSYTHLTLPTNREV